MLGFPFWGETTFLDIRDIVSGEAEKVTGMELLGVTCDDLYTLLVELAKTDYLYVVQDEYDNQTYVSWCRDIRFNYRDRILYIPYYSYATFDYEFKSNKKYATLDYITDTTVRIKHSVALRQCIIDNRVTKSRNKELYVFDRVRHKVFCIGIENLPYLSSTDWKMSKLFNLYLDYVYKDNKGNKDGSSLYYQKIGGKRENKESYLRAKLGLPNYAGNYEEMIYRDFPLYDYAIYQSENAQVMSGKPYWLRRGLFEGYLYCAFASNLPVHELEYRDALAQLGTTRRTYKVCNDNVSMVLKYYYKDDYAPFVRKSYERFKDYSAGTIITDILNRG